MSQENSLKKDSIGNKLDRNSEIGALQLER